MTKPIILTAALLCLSACATAPVPQPEPIMVGGDQDAHGCKASAGYSWSQVKAGCVRIWEAGTRLENLSDKAATTSAFVIISADATQAELFIPNIAGSIVLTQNAGGAQSGWSDQATGYTLKQAGATGLTVFDKSQTALYGMAGGA